MGEHRVVLVGELEFILMIQLSQQQQFTQVQLLLESQIMYTLKFFQEKTATLDLRKTEILQATTILSMDLIVLLCPNVKVLPGQSSYCGSTQNRNSSNNLGSYPETYIFVIL